MLTKKFSYIHRNISRPTKIKTIQENSLNLNNVLTIDKINYFFTENKRNIDSLFGYMKKNIPYYVTEVLPKNIENFALLKTIEIFKINYTLFLV